jgi:hypothetical protein
LRCVGPPFSIETDIDLGLASRQATPQCLPYIDPGRGAIF